MEINGQVASEEGYSIIGTDALKIGRDAGNEIDLNGKSHVFIGHDAGSKAVVTMEIEVNQILMPMQFILNICALIFLIFQK